MTRRAGGPRSRIKDDYDGAWKNMLTERRFADFVSFFLPDLYDRIDWSRQVVFREQEMRAITRKTKRGQRAVDRLVQVWLQDGAEQWVLIHIEIQAQWDADLPGRMFRYFFRAFDLFDGQPLTCLAILGDELPDWKPQGYNMAWWGTDVAFRFRIVKLMDYISQLDVLERSRNPFARFVLAHLKTIQTRDDYETRLAWKLRIIQGLYDLGVPEAEIGQLYHDFDWLLALPERLASRYHQEMVQFEEKQSMTHLSTAERIGLERGEAIGRERGEAIGLEQGETTGRIKEALASIREILDAHPGTVPTEVAVRLAQIRDLDRLQRLRRLLITGAPIGELERELNGGDPQ